MGSAPISGKSISRRRWMSPRSPREGRGTGRERSLRSDHQKYGGATRSRTSEKYPKKALFEDISQNRGFECSATILQVAPKSPLPADPEQSRRDGFPVSGDEPSYLGSLIQGEFAGDDRLEVGRQRRGEGQALPCRRMKERQGMGMEEDARECPGLVLAAVDRIADDGVPGRGQVDPDLVGPPRDRLDLEERRVPEGPLDLEEGLGLFGAAGPDGDPRAFLGVAAEGPAELAPGVRHPSPSQGEIGLPDDPGLELVVERSEGPGRMRHDHHA